MFEILTYAYASTIWALYRIYKNEKEIIKSFSDPGTFISGALAGGLARACAMPLSRDVHKKPKLQAIARRMPQFGFLMMFYVRAASCMLPGLEEVPFTKMVGTFLVAACAGFNMRLLCNPISRVLDESLRTGNTSRAVVRLFKSKTILHFWYTGPNLFANALYFGMLLTVFEGLRRFAERNWFPAPPLITTQHVASLENSQAPAAAGKSVPSTIPALLPPRFNATYYYTTIATNFVCGGTAAAVASTLCYPYSAHRYLQTVIHDSALCRGLMPTLMKEVPMMAVFFAAFSALEPFLSPQYGMRGGFGY